MLLVLLIVVAIIIFCMVFMIIRYRSNSKDREHREITLSERELLEDELTRRMKFILEKYREETGIYPEFTLNTDTSQTFTRNKQVINLCMINSNKNKFFDTDTLMHVFLHEMAHVLCKQWDINHHGEEFKRINEHLSKIGEKLKVFDPSKIAEDVYIHACT